MADRKSKDQKRKAKLAERVRKQVKNPPLAYAGKEYKGREWVPHMYRTERGVYEGIIASGRTLTNSQVEAAYTALIAHLRSGQPALLPEDAAPVEYAAGRETEYLVWNVRRHWGLLFAEKGPVAVQDLIGILRTLLYSMDTHAFNTGPERGYVDFLYGFLGQVIK